MQFEPHAVRVTGKSVYGWVLGGWVYTSFGKEGEHTTAAAESSSSTGIAVFLCYTRTHECTAHIRKTNSLCLMSIYKN